LLAILQHSKYWETPGVTDRSQKLKRDKIALEKSGVIGPNGRKQKTYLSMEDFGYFAQ